MTTDPTQQEIDYALKLAKEATCGAALWALSPATEALCKAFIASHEANARAVADNAQLMRTIAELALPLEALNIAENENPLLCDEMKTAVKDAVAVARSAVLQSDHPGSALLQRIADLEAQVAKLTREIEVWNGGV